ncbi:hypothetical protein [Prosthecobacter algae]|uniref:hypothetical protein n=1 Tax=Prosthecobacter algae TaxID=1144682 RepID=UPI0031E5EE84
MSATPSDNPAERAMITTLRVWFTWPLSGAAALLLASLFKTKLGISGGISQTCFLASYVAIRFRSRRFATPCCSGQRRRSEQKREGLPRFHRLSHGLFGPFDLGSGEPYLPFGHGPEFLNQPLFVPHGTILELC